MNEFSQKKQKELNDATESMILSMSNHTDKLMQDKLLIDKFKKINPENENIEIIENTLNCGIHISYLYMELACSLRHFLSAKLNFEKRYALKHTYIIQVEGYKKLYGFGKSKNISFWNKEVKIAVSLLKNQQLTNQYNFIGEKLSNIGKTNIFNQDYRNIAVHYDKDVSKVYKMLIEISTEEVAQNAISFMNILNETLTFLRTINTEINNKLEIQNNQFEEKIRSFTNLIKK